MKQLAALIGLLLSCFDGSAGQVPRGAELGVIAPPSDKCRGVVP